MPKVGTGPLRGYVNAVTAAKMIFGEVTPRTRKALERLVRRGVFPNAAKVGTADNSPLLIPEAELQAYLETRKKAEPGADHAQAKTE